MIKETLAVFVLCGFAQAAVAKDPACRSIQGSSERLACYDLATPPKAQPGAVIEGQPSRPTYKDPFVEEEARTAAKLRNICRGC